MYNLFGCCLIYSYSGLTQLDSIYNIISVNSENTILWGVYLGIIFIIIGLLTKNRSLQPYIIEHRMYMIIVRL